MTRRYASRSRNRSCRNPASAKQDSMDVLATSASTAVVQPKAPAQAAYSPSTVDSNSTGSSVLRLTRTPARRRTSTGCWASDGATPRRTLEVGHTSSGIPSAASRPTSAGSSTARTPWSMRSAPSTSMASSTPSGPLDSPAWAQQRSPAALASANAAANRGPVRPVAASLPSIDNATTRRWRRATSRSTRSSASAADWFRFRLTHTPTGGRPSASADPNPSSSASRNAGRRSRHAGQCVGFQMRSTYRTPASAARRATAYPACAT